MIPATLASFLLAVVLAAPRVNSHPLAPRNSLLLHPLLRQDICPAILRPDCPRQQTSQRQLHYITAKNTYFPGSMHANSVEGLTPRVVNGKEVMSDRLRALAVLTIIPDGASGTVLCSGSLISSTWVLTAAQCGYEEGTVAVIGSRQVNFTRDNIVTDGKRYPVINGILHPGYNESDASVRANDIALFQLDSPAGMPPFMKLNMNPSVPERGSITRIFGYGITEEDEETSIYNLRQIDMPVFPIDQCDSVYEGEIIPERHICVGYESRECGICNGDAGGPVFQYDGDDNPVLIGIATRGEGCARPGLPSYNTRVSAFVDWVRRNNADFTLVNGVDSMFQTNKRCEDDDEDGNGTDPPIAVIVGSIAGALALIIIVIGGIIWFRKGGLFCMRQKREERKEENVVDSTVSTM